MQSGQSLKVLLEIDLAFVLSLVCWLLFLKVILMLLVMAVILCV